MGPLAGVKIVEFAGIGPGPMCAMLLADLGADILRICWRQASLSHRLFKRRWLQVLCREWSARLSCQVLPRCGSSCLEVAAGG